MDMEILLEDGGGAAVALVGGVGRQCWAAVEDSVMALGGTSGRRTCNNGVSVSIIKA
jgi:hypothetical protein